MKKVLFTLLAGLTVSAQVMAISATDVCGQFEGLLNIDGSVYNNKTVYLLPGAVDNAVTFVLPDFTYNSGKLGNIVLPNIPMDANGQLTLENSTLYVGAIHERATITVLNGLEDGGIVYNSILSEQEAQVLLTIAAPSLPQPILVLFAGQKVQDRNYQMPNGGFEGEWTDFEPEGWHSFWSATGLMVDFIKNNYQFTQAADIRPGTTGSHSALLSSTMALGVKANGNCTNGQINAGSSTADDPANNYNFSDPENAGFNTPFHGRPDSIVFWAKYVPADRNAANEVNRARLSAVITNNAHYQDPETADFASAKIAEAVINYAAADDLGWQRIAVPFAYSASTDQPAYILTTFTTNMVPGGGSSYTTGSSLNKVNVLDSVYLDDVEMVYNRDLSAFRIDENTLSFDKHVAAVADTYCDDCAAFLAQCDGRSAQAFVAFDAIHRCIFVYVIADDYIQSGNYSLYRIDFSDSQTGDLKPIDPTEGMEKVQGDKVQSTKVLRNGMLYIIRGDELFDLNGRKVRMEN